MRMDNEIAYLMPTKYKIFLRGRFPLQPGPLRTPCSQTVLPTIQNGMMPMHKAKKKRKLLYWRNGLNKNRVGR